MKRKIFLVLFTIFLISLEATIIPYGNVYGTWDTSGSPYLVNGDIFITAGEELNIEPGVIIEFQGRFRFRIYGRIVAAGTETDSIIFTSNDPETGWRGMRFYNTNENEQDSSLVSYCRFEYGKALIGSYGDRRGGAIYCYNSSDICFNHCLFINNEADYGGGMALYESSPLISNSIFDSNISYHDGGGLIISSNSEPDFVDVTISRNQCNFDGGGIFCSGESELVLSNVLICENMAVDEIDGSGAGIACWGANLILNNVVISGNRACWGAGGIECIYASSMYLTDVIIEGNRGQSGAGIYIGNDSEAFLSGTTVRRNQTQYSGGGGIYIGYEADVNFDQVNRCNIYLNACTHYNATGMDLYSFVAGIDVYVDTFTVAEPTELFANPIYNFNFDIEQGLLELTDENIYVSPEGADINSGLTPEDPIRSIFQALLMAQPDAEDPVTIYLAEGTYSPSLTGEIYPLPVHDNFILQGSTTEQSILDAEYLSNIFYFYQISDVTLSDLILQHGSNWQGGAIYSNYSEFSINNTIIRDNKAEYNGGGICAEYANTITMDDVVITNNATDWGPAGGIYISSSTLNLTGCTIKENRGGWQTGGIWISSSNLNFDPNNRCNIYFNVNTSGNTANDLGCNTSTQVTVIVDTFTVLLPDNYYASPIANFTFDILNAIYDPVDADLYVNPEGSDLNSGLSPEAPLRTITRAYHMIYADAGSQNTIYLSPGCYSPSTNGEYFPLNCRAYTILQGEDALSTILDADSQTGVINILEDAVTIKNLSVCHGNSYTGGGIYINAENTILEGLRIHENFSNGSGGGVRVSDCIPMLIDCDIFQNYAENSGGGIYLNTADAIFFGTSINRNTVQQGYGGGLYCDDSHPFFNTQSLCSIYQNSTRREISQGHDLYANTTNIDVIVDTFTVNQPNNLYAYPDYAFNFSIENYAVPQYDQDLYVSPFGSDDNTGLNETQPLRTIRHAMETITCNSENPHTIHLAAGLYSLPTTGEEFPLIALDDISIKGAGINRSRIDSDKTNVIIYCEGAESFSLQDLTLRNGKPYQEYSSYFSGGIYCYDSSLLLKNVIIKNCEGSNGGGLYSQSSDIELDRVFVINNTATAWYQLGAGIYAEFSDVVFKNVTIAGNNAPQGYALSLSFCNLVMVNSLCWQDEMDEIYAEGNPSNQVVSAYNNIEGGQLGIICENVQLHWNEGNINEPPLFIDPGSSNYDLQEDSPCIDAGTAYYEWNGEVIIALSEEDYSGEAPDIGACEYGLTDTGNQIIPVNRPELSQNYPNPFNPETTINLQLPVNFSKACLQIFNIKGQLVRSYDIDCRGGNSLYQIIWDGSDQQGHGMPSGVYFYRLRTKGYKDQLKKCLLLK